MKVSKKIYALTVSHNVPRYLSSRTKMSLVAV